VAAEDTRRTRHLLTHLGLRKRLVSYREQNRAQAGQAILAALEAGQDVALVSDAGTPAVFDPGTDLVRLALEAGRGVVPIPGPAAAAVALSVAGLAARQYTLAGFLPAKAKARRERLKELGDREDTLVFFETPHRLSESLADLAELYGPRPAVLCRELTKLNEEVRRADLAVLAEWAKAKEAGPGIKGEFCLVVAGRPPAERPQVGLEELAQAWRAAGPRG
jgi:16S rRNA (cytidine1402-2'-O)-methyltransferase